MCVLNSATKASKGGFLFLCSAGIQWAFWISAGIFHQFCKVLFTSHHLFRYCLFSLLLSPFGTAVKFMLNFLLSNFFDPSLLTSMYFFLSKTLWTISLDLYSGSQVLSLNCCLTCASGFKSVVIFSSLKVLFSNLYDYSLILCSPNIPSSFYFI